jgi:predicted RNA-binding Zn-ribbon protein involved in translation (DUF1610 family)
MYHCDRCGWDGDTPMLREWVGEGCGGVVWTLRDCPECGEEVYETRIIRSVLNPLGKPDDLQGRS